MERTTSYLLINNRVIFALSLMVCILVAHGFRYIETFAIQTARRFSSVLMYGG